MLAGLQVLDSVGSRSANHSFAAEVRAGLSKKPKTLPASGFYDARGSRLFQEITKQPEYYLTRCELEILGRCAPDLARELGTAPFRLVEIGAGSGEKTELLLQKFAAADLEFEYVPIDICRNSVFELTNQLARKIHSPRIRIRGIVAEYFDAFPILRRQSELRKLTLFLGSSIGNFGIREARQFLRAVRQSQSVGDLLLIGFDLKKDLQVLQQAYDDAAGVTREFNFNLLDRINSEFEAEFDRRKFIHFPSYNIRLGCMESHLVSTEPQQVRVHGLKMTARFDAWEGIRVERSYKYDLDLIQALAAASGFRIRQHFFDQRRYFVDSLWEAVR